MGSKLCCCKYLKDEYELVDNLYEIDEVMFLGNVMKSIVKGRFNLKDLTSTSVKCSIKYYVVRTHDHQSCLRGKPLTASIEDIYSVVD
jgi:hypothetical protein